MQREQMRGPLTVLMMLGLFGASLLYGESVITPAISVLSAMEGLEIAAPVLHSFVVPGTVVILIGLFMVQKRGTGGIGTVLARDGALVLEHCSSGLPWILREPAILTALNPAKAFRSWSIMGCMAI